MRFTEIRVERERSLCRHYALCVRLVGRHASAALTDRDFGEALRDADVGESVVRICLRGGAKIFDAFSKTFLRVATIAEAALQVRLIRVDVRRRRLANPLPFSG
jgi:hypothetical protein